jgi:hypothetical protein
MFRITTAAIVATIAGTAVAGGIGPDIIVGSLDDVNNYGVVNGIRGYSVGTTACNIGDQEADWIDNTDRHPVISTTMWKYDHETARLTQIGVTQLKHSFASLQLDECDPCTAGFVFDALQPGCSDPYGAGLNGTQRDLGPRSEVNPYTGAFPYPFTGINQTGNAIFKRIQVQQSVIDDSTADFYVEGQYTVKDDFEAGTHFNNVSYKALNINQNNFSASTTGSTFREVPAIYAWQAEDPSVQIEEMIIPGDGKVIVASKVTDLGNGTWQYDYGVYNQNSDKAIASVSVPKNTSASGLFFNDVSYHSPVDQNISGADWNAVDGPDSITWSTDKFATNQWGNAIRWGTMYNFCFVTDQPPTQGNVDLGLFKAGADVSVAAIVPTQAADECPVDLNNDGSLNFGDVTAFLTLYANQKAAADLNNDDSFNFGDVTAFLTLYAAGCP